MINYKYIYIYKIIKRNGKRKFVKNPSNINENNSYKKLVKNISKKSMTYRLKFDPIKPSENSNINKNNNENIENNNDIENEDKKNNKNYIIDKSKVIFETKRVGKRRATERNFNMLNNSLYKNTLKKTKLIDKDYVFDF